MSSYSLEVAASFVEGFENDNSSKLDSVLGIIARIHKGTIVESSDSSTKLSYQRKCVNILDCDNMLKREVEWLRKKFPDTRFTLKELT